MAFAVVGGVCALLLRSHVADVQTAEVGAPIPEADEHRLEAAGQAEISLAGEAAAEGEAG